MRLLQSMRLVLVALVLTLGTATSHAQLLISVHFAPPVLPVYEQPICPQPGLMWTPGYWAYAQDYGDYYWVPGAWVPAPYEGALWTPGYWGWTNGLFYFHEGYWGRHVGYYGGVNYGFGYGGIGFAGGEWRPGGFFYNTAVMHVDGRYVHNSFVDQARVERSFVARDSHVAFSGGPGGIRHDPAPEERIAEHEQHMAHTSFQQQHEGAARADRSSFAKANGGRPSNPAVARPLAADRGQAIGAHSMPVAHPAAPQHTAPQSYPAPASHPTPQSHAAPASHPAPESHAAPKAEPKPASHEHESKPEEKHGR